MKEARMNIRFLGHACFLVTDSAGTKIVFDPYEPGGFGGGLGYGPLEEPADIVLISHDHGDHNFAAGVPGDPQVIKGAGEHSVGSLTFRGIAAKHDAKGGSDRGEDTIFCAEIDGVRVCHLGDLGHQLSRSQVADIGPVDVLMCPVGGFFTIDAQGATMVMKTLEARITIPMHYKTPKAAFPIAAVDDFVAGKTNVRHPGASDITVTRESLPDEPEIVVLEPAL
jgi:L-ascorbate metabolism protein UlaG (beta-lactamase superfamily)